jgi:hypothetical protein
MLTANCSVGFVGADGSIGVLVQDATGNVWWYTGTQAGGLTSVQLLASTVDPTDPAFSNLQPPTVIPDGVLGAAPGFASTVPQPSAQVNADGSLTVSILSTGPGRPIIPVKEIPDPLPLQYWLPPNTAPPPNPNPFAPPGAIPNKFLPKPLPGAPLPLPQFNPPTTPPSWWW